MNHVASCANGASGCRNDIFNGLWNYAENWIEQKIMNLGLWYHREESRMRNRKREEKIEDLRCHHGVMIVKRERIPVSRVIYIELKPPFLFLSLLFVDS